MPPSPEKNLNRNMECHNDELHSNEYISKNDDDILKKEVVK